MNAVAQPRVVMKATALVKRYGQVVALDGTDFELRSGEILAVIGDNGAGKSSLIKALSGATVPDSGEIQLDGVVTRFRSPIEARRAGIETVYQDLAVAPAMTIAENLFLGREMRRPGWRGSVLRMLDKRRMIEESVARLAELKVGIRSMSQALETLSGGQRQCVAVARAAAFAKHVVIMDEPTAALGVPEQRKVMELIRGLKSQGVAVILVSHNLHDIFGVADRIVVMRRGEMVGERATSLTDGDEIVRMMVGDTYAATRHAGAAA